MRILLFLVSAPALLAGTLASAQEGPSRSDVLEGIKDCQAVSIEFMRDACIDAANEFLKRNQEVVSPNGFAPDVPTASPATESLEDERGDIELARAALAKERTEIEQARAVLEEEAQAQDKIRAENERLGLFARLGLTGDSKKTDEKIAVSLTIERATRNRQNIYTFYTSDGDTIRQDRDTLRMRLPEEFPATATLERRIFGSKWLTFSDRPGRSYKVKVLQTDAD